MVGGPAKFPIVLSTHCCPGRQAGGDAMRDWRHNEEWRPGGKFAPSSIVRLAQGWEEVKMEDRGGLEREEKFPGVPFILERRILES